MLDSYSARRGFVIVPNDALPLPNVTRAIYVGTGGDITVLLIDDTVPLLFKSVPTGTVLRVRASYVMAGGTGALNLIGLY